MQYFKKVVGGGDESADLRNELKKRDALIDKLREKGKKLI